MSSAGSLHPAALTGNVTGMPPRFQGMLADQQTESVIADYMAGMTDRYAEKVYTFLNGGNPPPLP